VRKQPAYIMIINEYVVQSENKSYGVFGVFGV